MLKNKKITVIIILFFAVIFLLPHSALADALGVNDLADAGVALGTKTLKETIGGIVNIVLGFLGVLVTLIILYGGFVWMTSAGNSEKVDRAKRIIINAVIGLLILLSSYAIARFVLQEGFDAAFGPGAGGGGNVFIPGVGLGAGVLESHYPPRNALDVPRNTNIYLTFKEPMDIDFIVADPASCTGISCPAHPDFIRLFAQGENDPITEGDLLVSFAPYDENTGTGQKVFELNPYGNSGTHLGSNTADVRYRMELNQLMTLNGSEAFPYSATNSYSWIFTVGTDLDVTPPQVTSVRPVAGSTNPINTIVQVNFSEPVNPISASGSTDEGFDNVVVSQAGGALAGRYLISNQYRTVEFVTQESCGENSCGEEVFCLPRQADLTGTVSGTAGDPAIPDVQEAIVDMAGNVLLCTDSCQGSDYVWNFSTDNTLNLTAPTIDFMDDPNDIGLSQPINASFDRELLSSSVNSENILLEDIVGPINYWLRLLDGHIVSINHDTFDSSSSYFPTMTSGIRDIFQNCWYPCVCDDPDSASCVCSNPVCVGDYCQGS